MKFIALIHNNPAAWQALSQERARAAQRRRRRLPRAVSLQSGELLGGAPVVLAAPVEREARWRARTGLPAITDGSFAEAEELLAGFWLLDCDSFEQATEIATRHDLPARVRAVDVRPVRHMAG